jgi:hypothetical protein
VRALLRFNSHLLQGASELKLGSCSSPRLPDPVPADVEGVVGGEVDRHGSLDPAYADVKSRYPCPRLASVAMRQHHGFFWACRWAEPRLRTPSSGHVEHDGSAAGRRQG